MDDYTEEELVSKIHELRMNFWDEFYSEIETANRNAIDYVKNHPEEKEKKF